MNNSYTNKTKTTFLYNLFPSPSIESEEDPDRTALRCLRLPGDAGHAPQTDHLHPEESTGDQPRPERRQQDWPQDETLPTEATPERRRRCRPR